MNNKSYLVFDIESSKIPQHNPWVPGAFLTVVGIQREDGTSDAFWYNHQEKPGIDFAASTAALQKEIDKVNMLVAHNTKFDLNWLRTAGINLDNVDIWCTQVAEYLINGQKKIGYKLNDCSKRRGYGEKRDAMKEWWDAGNNTDTAPINTLLWPYLKQDLDLTHSLFKDQKQDIERLGLTKIADLSFETSIYLSEAESKGIEFDLDEALGYLASFKGKTERIEQRLGDIVGETINFNSPDQKSALLFGGKIKKDSRYYYTKTLKSGRIKECSRKCKIDVEIPGAGFTPIEGTEAAKEGYWSTDAKKVLKFLRPRNKTQRHVLNLMKLRGKFSKITGTFESEKVDRTTGKKGGLVNKVGNDGRVHPTFNQTTTVTGRLSSSNPNAQNLPRKGTSPVKKVFKSTRGKIVNIDLSQIEFRIGADLSRDTVMMNEIKAGLDTHADNALRFFKVDPHVDGKKAFKAARQNAKIMTFRLLYGGTASGFAKDATMPEYPLKRWKEIVDQYYGKYKILQKWQQRNIKSAAMHGALRNPSGRILSFTKKRSYDGSMSYNPAEACNYPVQSGSADLIFLALVYLMRRIKAEGLRCDFIITVHDSLVFDCHDDDVQRLCELGLEVFESLPQLANEYFGWHIDTPLTAECEVGDTYGTMKTWFPCLHCGEYGPWDEDEPICYNCSGS